MTSSEEEEEEPSVPSFSKFSSKETELPHTLAFTNNKEGEPLIVAGMRNGNLQVSLRNLNNYIYVPSYLYTELSDRFILSLLQGYVTIYLYT